MNEIAARISHACQHNQNQSQNRRRCRPFLMAVRSCYRWPHCPKRPKGSRWLVSDTNAYGRSHISKDLHDVEWEELFSKEHPHRTHMTFLPKGYFHDPLPIVRVLLVRSELPSY